jgi:acyl-coenzyme A thioesterase PaaI-like protein
MVVESALPTSRDLAEFADRIRRHFDDGCFACGRQNPVGLGVDGFRFDGDDLVAEFTPRSEFRGGPEVLHGGIAAAALDEILAWAGMIQEEVVIVTATLELKYRKPVPSDGRPITLRARLEERNGRRLKLSGSLDIDDTRAVTGSGVYVVLHDLNEVLGEAP